MMMRDIEGTFYDSYGFSSGSDHDFSYPHRPQCTGRMDFEDGLRTGTKLEVKNGLQSVRTIPGINLASPLGLAMTLGA